MRSRMIRGVAIVAFALVTMLGLVACSGGNDSSERDRNQELAKRGFSEPGTVRFISSEHGSIHSGGLGSCRVTLVFDVRRGVFIYEPLPADDKTRLYDVNAKQLLALDAFAPCRAQPK